MKIIVINIEAFHYIQTFRDNEIWKELFLPTEIENMFNGFARVFFEHVNGFAHQLENSL